MKKLNRYFLLLLAVIGLVGLSACKDDDDPFVGSDNYIHEFTLNVSGKSYEGYILNDIIEFVLPTGTDLKGLMRSGCSDEELTEAIQKVIWEKPVSHHFTSAEVDEDEARLMSQIGG